MIIPKPKVGDWIRGKNSFGEEFIGKVAAPELDESEYCWIEMLDRGINRHSRVRITRDLVKLAGIEEIINDADMIKELEFRLEAAKQVINHRIQYGLDKIHPFRDD